MRRCFYKGVRNVQFEKISKKSKNYFEEYDQKQIVKIVPFKKNTVKLSTKK